MNEPRFTATLFFGSCASRLLANTPAELEELRRVAANHYVQRRINRYLEQWYPGPIASEGESR